MASKQVSGEGGEMRPPLDQSQNGPRGMCHSNNLVNCPYYAL